MPSCAETIATVRIPPYLAYAHFEFAPVVRALSNFTLDFYKRLQSLCSTFPNLHNRKQLSVLDVTNARSKAPPICTANAPRQIFDATYKIREAKL